jgi:catechol 2,3-dioxygenase-like lactoylglutathione lyase family enzyme
MSEATSSRPQVNGILETSLYVERPTRSVEFYRRVFGFEPIDPDQKVFEKGVTANTDATGAIQIAFGIARSELPAWEAWLSQQGIPIEFRKTWKYGGEALYFRDPDGHLRRFG